MYMYILTTSTWVTDCIDKYGSLVSGAGTGTGIGVAYLVDNDNLLLNGELLRRWGK